VRRHPHPQAPVGAVTRKVGWWVVADPGLRQVGLDKKKTSPVC
jgi:hypothetical protein